MCVTAKLIANVSVGSKASIWPPALHFRSSPMNRHRQRPSACLKRATSGLLHRSNCFLFDHLIGELLELPRDFEAKGLRGFEIDNKLKLARPFDGQIARFCPAQDEMVPRS